MMVDVFMLTELDNSTNVFAVGVHIVRPDGEQEAVTFRRDPDSGAATFATFTDPERALLRLSMIAPMELVWPNESPRTPPDNPPPDRRGCGPAVQLGHRSSPPGQHD